MRVVILLIYLCSLLLRGYDYVYIGTLYSHISSAAQRFENGQPPKLTNTNRDDSVIRDAGPGEEEEYLVRNDVEDEDGNNFFARKYKLQASRHLIPAYSYTSGYFHNSFKDCQSFFRPSSYIYILQRVLRI